MNKGNFLDFKLGVFSEEAVAMARNGGLDGSMLITELERVYTLSQGLQQIFKIVRANGDQEITFEDADPGTVEPPLSPYTVGALVGLAEEVLSMMTERVEQSANWAETCADRAAKRQADWCRRESPL